MSNTYEFNFEQIYKKASEIASKTNESLEERDKAKFYATFRVLRNPLCFKLKSKYLIFTPGNYLIKVREQEKSEAEKPRVIFCDQYKENFRKGKGKYI